MIQIFSKHFQVLFVSRRFELGACLFILLTYVSCKNANQSGAAQSGKKQAATAQVKTSALAAMTVNTDIGTTEKQSLISIVEKFKVKVGLFQLVGVSCIECRDHSKQILAGLKKLKNQSDVHYSLVFVHQIEEYLKDEVNACTKQFFNSTPFVVDGDMSVTKSIRKREDQFFNMYIVVKKDGTAEKFVDDSTHEEVLNKVSEYLK